MACLSKDQIDFIRNNLKDRNVSRSILFEEWVDHVCCDVETMMNKGVSFDEAFSRVAGDKNGKEVKSAHTMVQSFMNHRYVGIKKLLLFAFLVFASSWAINIQYGSHWIGLASFLVLSLVYLRISMDFFRKRFVAKINLLLSVFSILSFLGTITGILLVFLERNYGVATSGHGVDLNVFGWFFFSLACLIYYIREYSTSIENKELRIIRWFIALSILNVFLSGLSIASFPLYHQVQNYLFYLIIFILAFNVVAILFLILTRSLKNTLILSLIIGSFMIVFIHSHFRNKLPGGQPTMHQLSFQYSPNTNLYVEKLYISMYYDKFPDHPITLPLNKTLSGVYQINMPSYAYKGYLYYKVRNDSSNAVEFFKSNTDIDSIALKIPGKLVYQLE